MKIKMRSTRWVSPLGVRLCLFRKGQLYEVSRYCGGYLYHHREETATLCPEAKALWEQYCEVRL